MPVSLTLIAWLLAGCGGTPKSSASGETPAGISIAETAPIPSVTLSEMPAAEVTQKPSAVDSGWESLGSGLERRRITLQDAARTVVEEIILLRIDPVVFSFDVAYDPQGKELDAWQSSTGAEVVVNGGYFRKEQGVFVPDGLIVAGGKVFGESYGDFAGMLAVRDTGPEVRWLKLRPYDPQEPLQAAVQSFPVLLKPGGQIGFPEESEDYISARRTVVGQDRTGRIVFLIASRGYFTLRRLSVYLYESDLDLDVALNLDGGPSSGVLIADPRETVPAESILPIVITVRRK